MKKAVAAVVLLFQFTVSFCQEKVPVFVAGTEGHKSYRIPAIIGLSNNDLLAFCEGRVNGAGDFGDINIVMKRSTDGGRTWADLRTLVDVDSLQAGNPAPVVDLADPAYPKGRIFLFYNTGDNHEGEVRKGKGLREAWYITSVDNGITWSKPINITTQIHRPKQPGRNPAYNFSEDWRSYANTPGHALQFEKGKYKGRIYVAANHSAGDPQNRSMDYVAHGYYSDDHGKTFHLANNVALPGSNESTAAELSNNRLMMNSRNQKGDIRARIISISSNGGVTWDTTYFDQALIDPVNEGSLLTIGFKKGKNILAFSNTADTKRRDNLTLRISYDEGQTWKKTFVIDKSTEGSTNDHAAYSDLVKMGKNKVGVLYEKDGYKQIVFTAVKWQ